MDLTISDNGSWPTIGTVSPKTQLHIRDMNNIEDVRAQIKVLEKQLALLEEIERYKNATLYGLIEEWWSDVFCSKSTDDMETCIDTLVNRIQSWLPREQSAQGSQNHYVECTVEGFNDCLNKIKGKLR